MNTFYNGDCLEEMKNIEDGSVDMVLTSPPYDNLRSYNENIDQWCEHTWRLVILDLYRIIKVGGVVVWIVGDATIKGSETCTSFKQALHAVDIGFRLHDTMIYAKKNAVPLTHNRYEPRFEYMFILSKNKPKTFNPIMIECVSHGEVYNTYSTKDYDSNAMRSNRNESGYVKQQSQDNNIWYYATGKAKSLKFDHPAPFPLMLAEDHIKSWSNEGDTVLDPFMGSGTTGVACVNLNRNFIGIELDEFYFDEACVQIDPTYRNPKDKKIDDILDRFFPTK